MVTFCGDIQTKDGSFSFDKQEVRVIKWHSSVKNELPNIFAASYQSVKLFLETIAKQVERHFRGLNLKLLAFSIMVGVIYF